LSAGVVTRVNDNAMILSEEKKDEVCNKRRSTIDDTVVSMSNTPSSVSITDNASSFLKKTESSLVCDFPSENVSLISNAPAVVPTPIPAYPKQPDTAPVATIHNLVGTCEIQSSITPIDLERVYRSLANSFYCRRRFAAITIRVTEPVCTGLLFTSGKLVITGCKTLVECVLASLKIVRMLERHIPTVTFLVRNAVVQNVVAHVVIPLQPGQRLNVDRLYDTWCCNCTFQKNMFPGSFPVQPLYLYTKRVMFLFLLLNSNKDSLVLSLTRNPQTRSHLQTR
jgi:TATA-box binding protein (TBP) (component of TFIID and TFIIIB)